MTDTQPMAPTDAELDELRQANSGKLNFVTLSEFRTIARAALAKWGVQPSPASQGDALDAARYRYLRDVPMGLWPAELLSAIRLQQNAKWDTNIDAARAAQEGN